MATCSEALQLILDSVAPLPTRSIGLFDALGLVLAETIVSPETVPPFTNSAMDGYALRADDCDCAAQGFPASLEVLADLPAGSVATDEVRPGTAIRIMTGAPLPAGADSVVPIEATASEGTRVRICGSGEEGLQRPARRRGPPRGGRAPPEGLRSLSRRARDPRFRRPRRGPGPPACPCRNPHDGRRARRGRRKARPRADPRFQHPHDVRTGRRLRRRADPVPTRPRHPRGRDGRPREGTRHRRRDRDERRDLGGRLRLHQGGPRRARRPGGLLEGRRRSPAARSGSGSSTASRSSVSRGTPSPPWSAWRSTCGPRSGS